MQSVYSGRSPRFRRIIANMQFIWRPFGPTVKSNSGFLQVGGTDRTSFAVRKTADARKDKMGPQWSQWVSRAVNKLADDGILDTSDPHGNVTFTPDAKKTITKVRRESMGPGVALSPGLERKIWKDVTQRLSGAGVKRRRRRSSATSMPDMDGWDDVETPPKKKQARKSSSRMTKAEVSC
ncbi:hypothetical protein PYCCODRAFT_1140618 [Trametes coccinea BRFM310]|uniref:Uncharacterized protein n=1 Tax=Trametes coccinea (strain BRFM310) TaxID=1353009 RepID=A0A1Y2I9N5_TRAC3|nr:hypothetical protein PYCCODRAFT_1140618 [Trametes coccinea BRFM310]